MKKWTLAILCVLLLSGCATSHMIKPDRQPELISNSNSATLVILRDTFFGGAIVIWNYLDGKIIGETMGNSYFVTQVPAGPHYVVAVTENTGVAHFDFKPGKTYFLRQGIIMGVWRARTSGYYPVPRQEAIDAIKKCTYYEYDPKSGGQDMEAELYKTAISEYEAGIKESPESYKELLNYDGV
jgi:hypothetical protein